jgi:hypothetical protein
MGMGVLEGDLFCRFRFDDEPGCSRLPEDAIGESATCFVKATRESDS